MSKVVSELSVELADRELGFDKTGERVLIRITLRSLFVANLTEFSGAYIALKLAEPG